MAKTEDSSKIKQIIVGGLGRPFRLGMLYNARRDELIPGMALWDSQTLQSLTVHQPKRSSHFDVSASDSTKDTSFNLNVEASLKLSFMSGLIEVGGSANYLKDKKESTNQCRVTLQYHATTHFEQLSLTADVCEKIQNSEIFKKGLATHVVTGIEYGANAFFVFDRKIKETEDSQKVKGQLEVTIKKIPQVEISGEGKVELSDDEKESVKTFSVKFYGDFLLESNPATFDAAVQTYVNLPKLLLGTDGNEPVKTVPVKVWLLPLEAFTLEPGPVTKSISVGLVLEAEDILEKVDSINMRCNDLLSVGAVGKFPELQRQLLKFYKLCQCYSAELQRHMAESCPAIREGRETESDLRSLFEQRNVSPFSQDKLSQWLEDKEREVNVVQSCLDIMKGIPVLSTQAQVDKFVLAPGDDERWGYHFVSLDSKDAQLDQMFEYLNAMKKGQSYEPPQESESAEKPWYKDNKIVAHARQKALNYLGTIELNQFITAKNNPEYTGVYSYKYAKGLLIEQWK